jgi:hypothetical protein
MIVGFLTWPVAALRAALGAQPQKSEGPAPRGRDVPALQNLRTVLEMPSTLDETLGALMTHLDSIDRAFWATHDQVARVNEQLDRVFRYLEPLERVEKRAERIQQALRRTSRAGSADDPGAAPKPRAPRRKPPKPAGES